MPYLAPLVSLAAVITATDPLVLVPSGNRITDISILPEPAGSAYRFRLRLGNNPAFGPITGACTITLDPDAPDSDASEGLRLINDAAQAGVSVPFLISYRREGSSVGSVRVLVR